MTIVRPCIVFGPNVDNYLVRLWTKQPFAVDVGTIDRQIQFVHEDDVVEAITGLLLGRHAGAFNVAGDGLMTNRECAELIGVPIRKMPLRAVPRPRARDVEATPVRGAAGRDRVRAPLVAALEREAEADDRLVAEATRAARRSRSRCGRTGRCRPCRPPAPSFPLLRWPPEVSFPGR